MLNSLKLIYKILDNTSRKKVFILLFLLLMVSLIEVISTAIFLPLLKLLQSDELSFFINSKFILSFFNIGFNHKNLLLIVSILIVLIYSIKLVVGIFVSRFRNNTIFKFHENLMNSLFTRFINRSYSSYLNYSSSTLIQHLFTESNQVRVLLDSYILLLLEILVSVLLISVSFYFNFKFTLVTIVFFIFIYFVWKLFSSNDLNKLSKLRKANERERLKLVQMLFLSFKEILLSNKSSFFHKRWNVFNANVISVLSKFAIKQETTKPILEFFSISTICLFILFFTLTSDSQNLFLNLGFFAAISYKLLPSINKIVGLIQLIKFSSGAIPSIIFELNSVNTFLPLAKVENKIFTFNNSLMVNNVSFSYENAPKSVFENIELEIKKGDFIGIIGESGAGKSTLVDILVGLLEPTCGYVRIDDEKLKGNETYWWNKISYVSQRLNLLEDTILQNIILGDEDYDLHLINKLLFELELESFVTNLKDGLETVINENGINISGGQKQRLLLARALYNNPEVLILDEATSSLDSRTESFILELLKRNKKDMTIIFITHKSNNLKLCNKIIKVENNNISIL